MAKPNKIYNFNLANVKKAYFVKLLFSILKFDLIILEKAI